MREGGREREGGGGREGGGREMSCWSSPFVPRDIPTCQA